MYYTKSANQLVTLNTRITYQTHYSTEYALFYMLNELEIFVSLYDTHKINYSYSISKSDKLMQYKIYLLNRTVSLDHQNHE